MLNTTTQPLTQRLDGERTKLLVPLLLGLAILTIVGFGLWHGRDEYVLLMLVGLAGGALILCRPQIGLYVVTFAALALDQYDMTGFNLPSARFGPVWRALSANTPVPLRLYPIEVLLLGSMAALVLQRAHQGRWPVLRFGRLFVPCVVWLGVLAYGAWRGLSHQDLQMANPFYLNAAIAELRGFAYIPFLYLMAHNVLISSRQIRLFVWVTVAALAAKTLQLTWVTIQLGSQAFSLNQISNHEDSLFLGFLIPFAAAIWLYRGPRGMRWTIAALLPLIAVVLVANNRRASFVALAVGLAIGWALLMTDGRLRKRVFWTSLVGSLVIISYGAAFWHAQGPLAVPVYAFRSISEPEGEKALSNVFRQTENVNIERTIERSPWLGMGFGQRYFMWVEEPELDTTGFTYWRYTTHNAIYWVWMKVGAIGFVLFWYLVGCVILLATQTFRRLHDGEMKAVALMGVCAVAMQIVFSYADLGLSSEKNMAYLGCWLGVLASLDRLVPLRTSSVPGARLWRH